MFNLRQDLKIYTSEKYSVAKGIADLGKRSGNDFVFTAFARIEFDSFAMNIDGVTPQAFKEFLYAIGGSSILSISYGYAAMAKQNPTKSYNDFLEGTNIKLAIKAETIETFMQKNLPGARMNALIFDTDSLLNRLLGKSGGWGRRNGRHKLAKACYLAWAIYGIEIPASSTRDQILVALKQVAPTDFGVTSCEAMTELIHLFDRTNAMKFDELVVVTKALDAAVAKCGGKPIVRKRPRQALLRDVYYEVTGEKRPAVKAKAVEALNF